MANPFPVAPRRAGPAGRRGGGPPAAPVRRRPGRLASKTAVGRAAVAAGPKAAPGRMPTRSPIKPNVSSSGSSSSVMPPQIILGRRCSRPKFTAPGALKSAPHSGHLPISCAMKSMARRSYPHPAQRGHEKTGRPRSPSVSNTMPHTGKTTNSRTGKTPKAHLHFGQANRRMTSSLRPPATTVNQPVGCNPLHQLPHLKSTPAFPTSPSFLNPSLRAFVPHSVLSPIPCLLLPTACVTSGRMQSTIRSSSIAATLMVSAKLSGPSDSLGQ